MANEMIIGYQTMGMNWQNMPLHQHGTFPTVLTATTNTTNQTNPLLILAQMGHIVYEHLVHTWYYYRVIRHQTPPVQSFFFLLLAAISKLYAAQSWFGGFV